MSTGNNPRWMGAVHINWDGNPSIKIADYDDEEILLASKFIRKYGSKISSLDVFCRESFSSMPDYFLITPQEALSLATSETEIGAYIREYMPFILGAVQKAVLPIPQSSSPLKSTATNGYIYAIRAENLFKIGRTNSPKMRTDLIMSSIPIDAKVFGEKHVLGVAKEERRLHEWFARTRKHGEWFALDDDQQEELRLYFEGASIEDLNARRSERERR